ncbi:hypothetical protein BU16DRAFT_536299 [Lophium mytilinum]|uniref:Uncharacterized protein n=1 Tax=Lophium mytilinum TaxID=390894 RepID=A0A6A6R2V7_9PEZI|nr:hypothetical protein BU16DRAFT_536299 [Lophium mytilinum]
MSGKFAFAELPGELQNRVYEFTLKDPVAFDVTRNPANGNKKQVKFTGVVTKHSASPLLAFSMISRKVYEDSATFFWLQNTFRVLEQKHTTRPHQVARAFLAAIGPRGRRVLKDLKLINYGSLVEGYDRANDRTRDTGHVSQHVRQTGHDLQVVSIQLGLCQNLQSLHIDLDLAELFSWLANSTEIFRAWHQHHLAELSASALKNSEEAAPLAKRQKVEEKEVMRLHTPLNMWISAAKGSRVKQLKVAWKVTDQRAIRLFTRGFQWERERPPYGELKAVALSYLRAFLEPGC